MFRAALFLLPTLSFCQKDETLTGYVDPSAQWKLTEVNDASVDENMILQFPKKGWIWGQGPCVDFWARQDAPYPWFQIELINTSQRDCPKQRAETGFLNLLQSMLLVEVAGALMILTNDHGEIMVFSR